MSFFNIMKFIYNLMFYDIMKFKNHILCHKLYTINYNFPIFNEIYI